MLTLSGFLCVCVLWFCLNRFLCKSVNDPLTVHSSDYDSCLWTSFVQHNFSTLCILKLDSKKSKKNCKLYYRNKKIVM